MHRVTEVSGTCTHGHRVPLCGALSFSPVVIARESDRVNAVDVLPRGGGCAIIGIEERGKKKLKTAVHDLLS